MSISRMSRAKLVVTAILVILIVIVVLQNLESVPVDILAWHPKLPKALLLIVTLAIGYAAGLVTAGFRSGRKKGK